MPADGDAAGGREALALESGVEGLEERERLADAPPGGDREQLVLGQPEQSRHAPLPPARQQAGDARRQVGDQEASPQTWVADVDHAASASQLSTR